MAKPKQVSYANAEQYSMANMQSNQRLQYKIKVLLHDFETTQSDPQARHRTESTTDVQYLSLPYFTSQEVDLTKNTLIPQPHLHEIPEFEELELDEEEKLAGQFIVVSESTKSELVTIEDAIESCLSHFLKKRKASGDFRPCAAHDMGPIYRAVFLESRRKS